MKRGQIVILLEYDQIQLLNDGQVLAAKDGQYTLYDFKVDAYNPDGGQSSDSSMGFNRFCTFAESVQS